MEGFPRRFGSYVLAKPLARGGMGALYLAVAGARGMEKLCVVKTALPHLAEQGYLQRFKDEAKVVVRLSHGNLVTVFDAGQAKGEIYLAMDFVEGKDLRATWNRCAQKGIAFPVPVAVHIVKELVRGLGYAHTFEGLKLVHRDVSPPNVLLSYSGEVKLTDFGLATSTLKLEKTAPGVIYGKVSYMAPEQARGEPLDARTDLYAAGVILWELLTGRQLFPAGTRGPAGASEDDLLERVKQPKIVPPSQRAARVPPELDTICMRALASEPKDRYQTGEQFRADLAAYLAKAAPATDGEQVARFLRELFGDSIGKERADRAELMAGAAALLETSMTTERPAFPRRPKSPPALSDSSRRPTQARQADETTTPAVSSSSDAMLKMPDEPSRLVGGVLAGRYHVRRLCGEGGMGRVYEAEHVEIGKRVALKVLHPAYSRTPEVVERFRREARAASKIGHPNIVNVTDSGTTDDGSFFFVMEYIEGHELGLVIHREGPMPVLRMLRITEQMCEALQAAHDAGVIHRDLKPENVLLVASGAGLRPTSQPALAPVGGEAPAPAESAPVPIDFVKVLDFGIAKSAEVEETAKHGKRLTRPGVAMGTPEYMAPEQAAGKPADPRSDIYAVGSIMYEMLTGSPPYDGDNVMEVLHKKANQAPRPLREIRPELEPEVEALVGRAMARNPDARPQSMGELAREIRALSASLAGAQTAVVSAPPPRRRLTVLSGVTAPVAALGQLGVSRRTMAIGAAVLVMLVALVVVKAASTPPRQRPARVAEQAVKPPPRPAPPPVVQAVEPVPPAPVEPAEVPPESPAEEAAGVEATVAEEEPRREGGARPTARAAAALAHWNKQLRKARELYAQHRYPEAKEAFTKLLAGPKRQRSLAMVGLANVAFQEKNYDEAVKRAREAAASGGGVEARLVLGDAYFKLEQYAQAKRVYTEALAMAPGNLRAKLSLDTVERRLR